MYEKYESYTKESVWLIKKTHYKTNIYKENQLALNLSILGHLK